MTDDSDSRPPWSPAAMAEQWQEAGERVMERQLDLFEQMVQTTRGNGVSDVSQLSPFGMGAATFKTRVQSGGRVSIPDAEREALDIEEGDIVQTIVVPVKRDRSE